MIIGDCINPLCKKEGRLTRGLCLNCYTAVKHLIRLGFTTMEKLEKSRRIHPKKRARVVENPIYQWFMDEADKEKPTKVKIRPTK